MTRMIGPGPDSAKRAFVTARNWLRIWAPREAELIKELDGWVTAMKAANRERASTKR